MTDIGKILDKVSIKIPHGFRDILSTLGGLLFLVAFSLTHYYSVLNARIGYKLDEINLNSIERDVLLIILGFFVGRILLILGDIIRSIYSKIIYIIGLIFIPRMRVEPIGRLRMDWKKSLYQLFAFEFDFQMLNQNQVANEVTPIDISKAIESIPAVSDDIERSVYRLVLLQLIYTSTFIGIFQSCYYVIPFVVFFVLAMKELKYLKGKDYVVYRHIVKNAHPKP